MPQIKCQKSYNAPCEKVFKCLTDPLLLPDLLKDHVQVEIENIAPQIESDSVFSYKMTRYGFSQPVKYTVDEIVNNTKLVYRQSLGLFSRWVHTESFKVEGEQTIVTDLVEYEMPLGIFGHILNDLYLKNDLKAILESRLEKAAHLITD